MIRGESIRGALILAAAFLLAATVGLAMSMGFDSDEPPVRDALAPADIAAALPALPETMSVKGLRSLHRRPPVRVAAKPHRKRKAKKAVRRHRVVRAVAAAAPAPAPAPVAAAPKAAPAPAPAPAPVAAPKPVVKPQPKPAPKPQAPVVFDDSA